jgi:hypothetical protein
MLGLGNTLSGGIVPAAVASAVRYSLNLGADIEGDGSIDFQWVNSNMDDPIDPSEYTTEGTWTFSYWFKSPVLDQYRPSWVYKDHNNKIQIEVRAAYVRFVHKTSAGGYKNNYVYFTQAVDTWYHYVVSCDPAGENFNCYINGAAGIIKSVYNNAAVANTIIALGPYNAATSNDDDGGLTDEWSFWDGVLTDEQVASLFNNMDPPDVRTLDFFSDCIDYWSFDDLPDNIENLNLTSASGNHDYSLAPRSNNEALISTDVPSS